MLPSANNIKIVERYCKMETNSSYDPNWDPRVVSEADWQRRSRFLVSDARSESRDSNYARETLPGVLELRPSGSMDGVSSQTRKLTKIYLRHIVKHYKVDNLDTRLLIDIENYKTKILRKKRERNSFLLDTGAISFQNNLTSQNQLLACKTSSNHLKNIQIRTRNDMSSNSTLGFGRSVEGGCASFIDQQSSSNSSPVVPLDLSVRSVAKNIPISLPPSMIPFSSGAIYPDCSTLTQNNIQIPEYLNIYNKQMSKNYLAQLCALQIPLFPYNLYPLYNPLTGYAGIPTLPPLMQPPYIPTLPKHYTPVRKVEQHEVSSNIVDSTTDNNGLQKRIVPYISPTSSLVTEIRHAERSSPDQSGMSQVPASIEMVSLGNRYQASDCLPLPACCLRHP